MLHSGAMQLKAKPKSLSGAVEAGLYYREARDERGTFLVGLLFHNTEKSMCSLMWQKKKKSQQALHFSVKKSVQFKQLMMRMYILNLVPQ